MINRTVETDSIPCQTSTITMHIIFLSLEILVILLTYLFELLKKWIKNGGEFKVTHIYLIPVIFTPIFI